MARAIASEKAPDVDHLLTSREAAALLNIHPKTLHALTRAGKIPVHKVGGVNRYDREEILDATRATPNAETAERKKPRTVTAAPDFDAPIPPRKNAKANGSKRGAA